MSENGFYRAFEDRYRGSRESIIDRLEVYLPFVEPLRAVYPESAAVDLGCGRGEWLQLMKQKGFDAVGVDIEEGMLSACSGLGLKTVKQDAIAFLRTLAGESQCVVSGFHFVEHLPFADLQVLVEEALRVLKPGGLLILETPNPENVAVGTTNFYLDPTHERPIPPLLLKFLPEHYGFARIKIVRLQEQPALVGKESVDLIDVFCGASPDYAIVAQKSAAPPIMADFDEPFAQSYGIELDQLANRFDAKLERRFEMLEQRFSSAASVTDHVARVIDRFAAAADELAALTNLARESEKFALAQGVELSRVREELETTKHAHQDEIVRLTAWARESEAYARAHEDELSRAREELEATKQAHAEEVARLTGSARESEVRASAQSDELKLVRQELETIVRVREEEAISQGKEIRRLSAEIESLTAKIEKYAKFWLFRVLRPPVVEGSGRGGQNS
ncbi:methyltransferase domain-containing protein [Azoarcus sp. DN11]|uniref:class I SAM-dependent methyltransferase n=1 Tax=Azoarcus sp. DN11 TaxID=356837 RepID=UPI000EB3BA56|nr:methyltransferase domain-containing protein [Azoarcus sp. DN11]AYH45334.1 hypothetical protein CDA09_18445 [Azoarcus sp. DN11]